MRDVPNTRPYQIPITTQLLQTQHQLGHHAYDVPFHVGVARTPLTRTFPSQFGEVSDEIRVSCNELLDCGTGKSIVHRILLFSTSLTSHLVFIRLEGIPDLRRSDPHRLPDEQQALRWSSFV